MRSVFIVLSVIFLSSSSASAQSKPADDAIGNAFYPPDLIMQNQNTIELSEVQRNAITKEIQAAQSEFTSLHWELSKETETLKSLIEKGKLEEAEVLRQLEKVLNLENKIKRRQILLLVRIKNTLTKEQQVSLQRIRANIH